MHSRRLVPFYCFRFFFLNPPPFPCHTNGVSTCSFQWTFSALSASFFVSLHFSFPPVSPRPVDSSFSTVGFPCPPVMSLKDFFFFCRFLPAVFYPFEVFLLAGCSPNVFDRPRTFFLPLPIRCGPAVGKFTRPVVPLVRVLPCSRCHGLPPF